MPFGNTSRLRHIWRLLFQNGVKDKWKRIKLEFVEISSYRKDWKPRRPKGLESAESLLSEALRIPWFVLTSHNKSSKDYILPIIVNLASRCSILVDLVRLYTLGLMYQIISKENCFLSIKRSSQFCRSVTNLVSKICVLSLRICMHNTAAFRLFPLKNKDVK